MKESIYTFIDYFNLPWKTDYVVIFLLILIGIILTSLIISIAVKIDDFIFYNILVPKRTKSIPKRAKSKSIKKK